MTRKRSVFSSLCEEVLSFLIARGLNPCALLPPLPAKLFLAPHPCRHYRALPSWLYTSVSHFSFFKAFSASSPRPTGLLMQSQTVVFSLDLCLGSPAILFKGELDSNPEKLRCHDLCHQPVPPHQGRRGVDKMIWSLRRQTLLLLSYSLVLVTHTCQTLGPSTPCSSPFPGVWPSFPELLCGPVALSTIVAHTGCGSPAHCLCSGLETAQCNHHLGPVCPNPDCWAQPSTPAAVALLQAGGSLSPVSLWCSGGERGGLGPQPSPEGQTSLETWELAK